MTFKDGLPIYVQIAERLTDEILAGRYGAEERVPGVREYSVLLEVNVNTTVKAYDLLAMRGIIYAKRGMGYFVAPDAVRHIRYARRHDFFEKYIPEIRFRMQQLGITVEELSAALLTPPGGAAAPEATAPADAPQK